ncbi:response regulator [Hyphobacterium sp.]|uniref:response regulator n=1 Tax=Hyphobacterium sp. TaxID=2004662 RepID=UPI003BAADCA9
MRVLIVDDDDGDVLIMKNCLHGNDNNVEILRAYDGGDALAILSSDDDAPDLVLLDLNMPGVDGHETLKEIRRMPAHEVTPVVVFTTSSSSKDIVMAYRNRANAYVQKPGSLARFRETMGDIKAFWLRTAKTVGRHAHA